jgi:hypothetical protein
VQLGWKGFDKFITRRVAEGAKMEDFLLVVPRSLGVMPASIEVRRGALSVMSWDRVDFVYLMDLAAPQGGLLGLYSPVN